MAAQNATRPASISRRLTGLDAAFLYAESAASPAHSGMLMFFEGEIPIEQLLQHIERRLELLPRYRQRLAMVPLNLAHASLEDDPAFKIENHVKSHKLPPSSEAEIIQSALKVFESPLSRERPLWEIHAFTGLDSGRTCVLMKIHQCLIGGVSPVEATSALFDLRADAPQPEPPAHNWTPNPLPGIAESLLTAIHDVLEERVDAAFRAQELLRSPKELADRTGMLADAGRSLSRLVSQPIVSAPWNTGLIGPRRNLVWSRYSFADFRAIRNAFGGTVNDVVLAMVSEAAARYLARHDCKPGGAPLRIACPVNVAFEDEGGTLGNRVSITFSELPAVPMNPGPRLEAVQQESERIKASREAQSLELLTETLNLVPPGLMGLTSRLANLGLDYAGALGKWASSLPSCGRFGLPAFGVNFMATNAPGVQVPQYLAGHLLLDVIGLPPLQANLGYGISILGYNQSLYFGMVAEPSLMPDLEIMRACLDQAFTELKQSAEARNAQAETTA
ncbi:MAG TPA: wax ester/triacylglycerol synthase domain-containing protein [Candidatus Binataceae bacterium]|nr:wax ester/triacylglycerol synthase domain-containing protein [Candidatus Binataceae bacterium]